MVSSSGSEGQKGMSPFITFEGIDGSGKTTQLRMLEEYLRRQKVRVVVAREPGGTPVGESIRKVLLDSKTTHLQPVSELLLYYASRHQNLHQVIEPALNGGEWVLCDRYADASMAYQGYGRGISLEIIEQLNRIAIGGHMPDLTLLIDIEPTLGLRRALERNSIRKIDESRFEKESIEFYRRVKEGYLIMAGKEPDRFKILQGDQPAERLHQSVLGLIAPFMAEKHVV
jgi:dTMP kinase